MKLPIQKPDFESYITTLRNHQLTNLMFCLEQAIYLLSVTQSYTANLNDIDYAKLDDVRDNVFRELKRRNLL